MKHFDDMLKGLVIEEIEGSKIVIARRKIYLPEKKEIYVPLEEARKAS